MKNANILDRLSERANRYFPSLLLLLFTSFALAVFMLPPTPVHAFPFFQEDEAGFLRWYEENKDADSAVYTLQGDLVLSSGTEETPIILNGTGNITVNCGDYVIVAYSHVILDNPNLTLSGNSYCTVYFTDGVLSLQQGRIRADIDSGSALYAAGENLSLISPEPGNRFTISAQGESVTGLNYYCPKDTVLSNLDIQVNGTQSGTGIEFLRTKASVGNCNIHVTGGLSAYGLYNYSSMQITKSSICAEGTSEEAALYSAGSPLEDAVLIWDDDSVLNPAPPNAGTMDKVYTVWKQVFEGPWTLPIGSYTPADFPDEVLCLVRNEASYENEEVSIPVQWDFSSLDTSGPGVTTVYGILNTESLDGIFYDAGDMRPKLYVVCVENNQIFIHSWSVYKADENSIRMEVVLPYPCGADSLRMQYSTDGIHYTDYAYTGNGELLSPLSYTCSSALFSTALYLPFYSPTLYLRAVISGNTLYAGTSPVWKLDITSGGGNLTLGYEGDRGGQTVENESVGNESTGSESTGSESTGNESTGSESTGNESTGSESTGSDTTGNNSVENNSVGNNSVENNPAVINSDSLNSGNEHTYSSANDIFTYYAQKNNASPSVSGNNTDEISAAGTYKQQNEEKYAASKDVEEYAADSTTDSKSADTPASAEGKEGKNISAAWIFIPLLLTLFVAIAIVMLKKRKKV